MKTQMECAATDIDFMEMAMKMSRDAAVKERNIADLLKITERQDEKQKAVQLHLELVMQSLREEIDRKKKRNDTETEMAITLLEQVSGQLNTLQDELTVGEREKQQKLLEISVLEQRINQCLPKMFAERQAMKERMEGVIRTKGMEIERLKGLMKVQYSDSGNSGTGMSGINQLVLDEMKKDLNQKETEIHEMKRMINEKDQEIMILNRSLNGTEVEFNGHSEYLRSIEEIKALQQALEEKNEVIVALKADINAMLNEKKLSESSMRNTLEQKDVKISKLEEQINGLLSEKENNHSLASHSSMQNVIRKYSDCDTQSTTQMVEKVAVLQRMRKMLGENDIKSEQARNFRNTETMEHKCESREWTQIISDFQNRVAKTQIQFDDAKLDILSQQA